MGSWPAQPIKCLLRSCLRLRAGRSCQRGVEVIARMMTAAGLTSVTEAECSPAYFTAYQDAYHAGTLGFRVYVMPQGYSPIYEHLKSAGLYTGFGDDHLKLGAVKWVADGSAQERTMRMSTPFADKPDDYGLLYMEQDEIDAAVEEAHRHRFQVGIHANGDVTIDMVLKSYERAQRLFPRPDPRFRIEHCSLVTPDLLKRMKAIGAIPTPFYTYVHYHGNKWVSYGEEKMRSMFAHASFLEYGIPVAPASDYIPGPFEPLMAIQSMVTRKDFEAASGAPTRGSRWTRRCASARSTARTRHSRKTRRVPSPPASWRTSSYWSKTLTTPTPTPSKRSRYCARSWEARPSTRSSSPW